MRPGGDGYMLGQPTGYGITQQSTIASGINPGAAKPAAGANFSFTCQPYDRWRLVAARFTLTTDANVADRYVTIDYLDGTGTAVASDGAAVAVTAGTTSQVFTGSINRGTSEWNNASAVFFPLSGLWIEAGQVVKITVANIQAADQLDKIRFTFDRWPENPLDYGEENWQAQELNERATLEQAAVALQRAADTLRVTADAA